MSNHKMQNKNGFSGAATEDETAMRLYWATSTEDAPRLGVREVQAHSFLLCPLIREVVIVRLRAGGRGLACPHKSSSVSSTGPFLPCLFRTHTKQFLTLGEFLGVLLQSFAHLTYVLTKGTLPSQESGYSLKSK